MKPQAGPADASGHPRLAAPPQDERQLVERLRAGDEAAFEELVRVQGPRLLALVRKLLRNEEDARDAVQEAFIAAWRSIGSFEGGARLSTWLHRIGVNAALMRLRTKRRHPEERIEGLLPGFLEDGHRSNEGSDWTLTPDVLLARAETREVVRACIDQLPESYRNVLLLRDIEELDTDETARALGVNANVVKTRLHRARQALRTLLDARFHRTASA